MSKTITFTYNLSDDTYTFAVLGGAYPEFDEVKLLQGALEEALESENRYYNDRDEYYRQMDAEMERIRSLPRHKNNPKTGEVYLMHDVDNNTLKIGFSKDPRGRLRQLSIATSNVLKLLYVITNKTDLYEKELHEMFSDIGIKNEWFKYNEKIVEFFKNNQL